VRPEQNFAEVERILRCEWRNKKVFFLYFPFTFVAGLATVCGAHFRLNARITNSQRNLKRKSAMSRTTASRPGRVGVRAALAALAIAASAAAPAVAFAEDAHLAKTTVTADPNDDYYFWITGDGGAGGGGGGG